MKNEPREILPPRRLRELRDPVSELWSRDGSPPSLSAPSVAVVGSRAPTPYGLNVAQSWSYELARAGLVVVSGLGRGIDAAAHRGALKADGLTVAVLGCGVDRDYPAAHAVLAAEILAAGGAIVSEYAPGVPPAAWRFPARGRIIAGLADVVLVVEARVNSGALFVADFALESGIAVMAVPGQVTNPGAFGPNDLLVRGVSTCAVDVSQVIELALERAGQRALRCAA